MTFVERLGPRLICKGRSSDFDYVVAANGMGFRCGYVCIPPGHPWYAKHYDDISADCHGGLTFSETLADGHWIGFDCAHSGDAQDPSLEFRTRMMDSGVIRTTEYVVEQCVGLCTQAAAHPLFERELEEL